MGWLNGSFGFFCANLTLDIRRIYILIPSDTGPMTVETLRDLIAQSLDADKGEDINIIDLQSQSPLADYMIVATGTSTTHVSALANNLKKKLELLGVKGIRMEGLAQSDWVAMDTGDVMVHLFRKEVRKFYNIEKMWNPLTSFDGSGSHSQISA